MINTCHARERIVEETFPTEEIDSILLSIKSINIPYETNYLKSRNSIFFLWKMRENIWNEIFKERNYFYLDSCNDIRKKFGQISAHQDIWWYFMQQKNCISALINFSTTKLKSIDLISKY